MINNLVCILGNDEVDCRRMADVSRAVYLSSSVQRYSAGDYRSSTCSGSYKSCGVYQSFWQAIPRSHFSDSFTAPPPPTRAARGAFLPWTFSAALGARVPAVDPKGMSSPQGCLWGCRRVVCCQQQCKVVGNSRLHRSCEWVRSKDSVAKTVLSTKQEANIIVQNGYNVCTVLCRLRFCSIL